MCGFNSLFIASLGLQGLQEVIQGCETPEHGKESSKPSLLGAGAETGAGGRIRDTHATGLGSIMGVATAGYCVGNLHLEGHPLGGEDPSWPYPASLAPPLQVGEYTMEWKHWGHSWD